MLEQSEFVQAARQAAYAGGQLLAAGDDAAPRSRRPAKYLALPATAVSRVQTC